MTNADAPLDPLGLLGATIADKYQVDRFVAEGGFSLLYRAEHKIWKQPVAVKFLTAMASAHPSQRQQLLDSFLQEGQLLRQLSSRTASILQAHDVGTWVSPNGEWYPYLILEWLDGKPLDQVLDEYAQSGQSPLSLLQIIRCLEPVAKALEVVHRRGVAHRDIKPANLFVIGDLRDGEPFVKVLDFGIAKVLGDMAELSAADAKTGSAIASFTPWYGAPEQFSKRYGATGPWTDVFAMALVMVEMLTLRPALEGDDVVQLSVQSANPHERPGPRERGVTVPDAVEAVFQRALAVRTTDRYPTMGVFWNELCQAAGASQFIDVATQGAFGAEMSRLSMLANAEIEAARASFAMTSSTPAPAPALAFGSQPTALPPVPPSASLPPSHLIQEGTSNGPITAPSVAQASPPPAPSAPTRPRWPLPVAALAALGLGAWLLRPSAAPTSPPLPAASASASAAALRPPTPPAGCPEGMVPIPGGDFYMGFEGEGSLDFEKPQHPVHLSPFCIDITEVTVEQYRACSDAGRCPRASTTVSWPTMTSQQKKVYSPLCNIDDAGRDRHPINCVDWEMADNYCQRQGKRLPTSAEWEFAVRGPDGRTYPWGNEPPDANHLNACGSECLDWARKNGVSADMTALHKQDDGYPTTAPVGSFPKGRSRYGLDDVIGNVMEWVHDWDGAYTKAASTDPQGPATGTERVVRGGAWSAGSMVWVRPSFRYQSTPDTLSHGIGFRCAR